MPSRKQTVFRVLSANILRQRGRLPANKSYRRGNNGKFSNPTALPVKRLFSLSLKTGEQSHIMPHSARNIAQQLDANNFR
jgi:hypothetical protein